MVMGCGSSSTESAEADKLTANAGQYGPAPEGVNKPKVGVPPWSVKSAGGSFGNGGQLNDLAADQATTLLENSERFRMIERTQLSKLLDEQNLEGIVKPGELAKPGQVRGVDYLLIGRVTNLRVKGEKVNKGFGLGQVGAAIGGVGGVNAGMFDYKNKSSKFTTDCGVDLRLVNPTTAEIVVSAFSEFHKTDAISAWGVDVLGASATADADIEIAEDDKGKILRLAIDDALRKAMPKIDNFLRNPSAKTGAASTGNGGAGGELRAGPPPVTTDPPSNLGTGTPVAAKKFCGDCGKEVAAAAKFCAACGKKAD